MENWTVNIFIDSDATKTEMICELEYLNLHPDLLLPISIDANIAMMLACNNPSEHIYVDCGDGTIVATLISRDIVLKSKVIDLYVKMIDIQ